MKTRKPKYHTEISKIQSDIAEYFHNPDGSILMVDFKSFITWGIPYNSGGAEVSRLKRLIVLKEIPNKKSYPKQLLSATIALWLDYITFRFKIPTSAAILATSQFAMNGLNLALTSVVENLPLDGIKVLVESSHKPIPFKPNLRPKKKFRQTLESTLKTLSMPRRNLKLSLEYQGITQ